MTDLIYRDRDSFFDVAGFKPSMAHPFAPIIAAGMPSASVTERLKEAYYPYSSYHLTNAIGYEDPLETEWGLYDQGLWDDHLLTKSGYVDLKRLRVLVHRAYDQGAREARQTAGDAPPAPSAWSDAHQRPDALPTPLSGVSWGFDLDGLDVGDEVLVLCTVMEVDRTDPHRPVRVRPFPGRGMWPRSVDVVGTVPKNTNLRSRTGSYRSLAERVSGSLAQRRESQSSPTKSKDFNLHPVTLEEIEDLPVLKDFVASNRKSVYDVEVVGEFDLPGFLTRVHFYSQEGLYRGTTEGDRHKSVEVPRGAYWMALEKSATERSPILKARC